MIDNAWIAAAREVLSERTRQRLFRKEVSRACCAKCVETKGREHSSTCVHFGVVAPVAPVDHSYDEYFATPTESALLQRAKDLCALAWDNIDAWDNADPDAKSKWLTAARAELDQERAQALYEEQMLIELNNRAVFLNGH